MDVKKEKTFQRVSDYSLWHRSLGSEFLAIDLDWIEFRIDRGVVALICTTSRLKDEQHLINSKKFIFKRINLERKIVLNIAEQLNAPAYFVIHTDDLKFFHVHDLNNLEKFEVMDQNKYGEFIKNL